MGIELTFPANEEMKLKAKRYLESLNLEEFKTLEALVAYITYLHIGTKEYLETVAEVIETEEVLKH